MATGPFDLIDGVTHKAVAELIAPDVQRFESIVDDLARTRSELSARLDGALARPVRVGAEAVERDQEVYHLTKPHLYELPDARGRLADHGHEVDRTGALEATYAWTRRAVARAVAANGVVVALLSIVVGLIAGATGSRLVQYAILGALVGIALALTLHGIVESAVRPARSTWRRH